MEVNSQASTQLVVTPHPLTRQGQTSVALLLGNENLLEVVQPYGVDEAWVVCVGGIEVPAAYWQRVKVKHGHVIECRRRVHKNSLNSVFKFVAISALLYFTFGAGGAFAFTLEGFTGLSGLALTFAQQAVFMGGMMVINRLLPNKKAEVTTRVTAESVPTYSLTGNGNRTRPWEPMSIVFGEPYVVPDLAAQPYTSYQSGEMYLTQIFHAGFNCDSVSDVKIGETLLSSYSDVQVSYDGFTSITNFAIPSSNVDSIAGALLDAPTAPGAWVVRTTSVDTIKAVVEIEAALFSVNQSSGAYEQAYCNVEIEYRRVGSTTWVSAAVIVLSSASNKRVSEFWNFSFGGGQWEIRVRKATANTNASSASNQVNWAQLKSYQAELGSFPGEARLGVVIKASGQLNGAIDTLNWIARARAMPYWNGSAWVTATNASNGLSNPGAQILLLARGIYDNNNQLVAGLGWSDARIDIENLKRFMVWCAAKGFTHNYIQQENISIYDLMSNIAAVGLGRLDWADGRLGVTFLSDTAPIECVVNMANMKAKSFSVSYPLAARADELEYGFFDAQNSNTWKSLRVLAPGVTNPLRTARMNNAGVTSETHAAIMARFQMAANLYMSKSITFEMDLEYLTFGLNTVIALSHDLTQWGYSGRVVSAGTEISEPVVNLFRNSGNLTASTWPELLYFNSAIKKAPELSTEIPYFDGSNRPSAKHVHGNQFREIFYMQDRTSISSNFSLSFYIYVKATESLSSYRLIFTSQTFTSSIFNQWVRVKFENLSLANYLNGPYINRQLNGLVFFEPTGNFDRIYNDNQIFYVDGAQIEPGPVCRDYVETQDTPINLPPQTILKMDLDAELPAGGQNRKMGLRLLGEKQYRIFSVKALTQNSRTVRLADGWPAGVPLPGASGTADALWIYDFKATPGAKCVVTSIEPSGTDSAKITVVPLPDEFWPYVLNGSYTPPPDISWTSKLRT